MCCSTKRILFALDAKELPGRIAARYSGQYGPGIQAVVLTFYYGMQASEPKILEFLRIGHPTRKGKISNWLIENARFFHAEKDAVYEAGIGPAAPTADR